EFGLPGTSTSQMELVDTLNAHLLAQHQAGRVSVVVVDEAQAFSMDLLEQLRLLSNLETATEKLLRVVLVGQPQLRTLLLDPAMARGGRGGGGRGGGGRPRRGDAGRPARMVHGYPAAAPPGARPPPSRGGGEDRAGGAGGRGAAG